jgi:hypothetical protein
MWAAPAFCTTQAIRGTEGRYEKGAEKFYFQNEIKNQQFRRRKSQI